MVAQYGQVFDFQFLLRSLDRHNLGHLWQQNNLFGWTLDTLAVARAAFSDANFGVKPTNNKLSTLYQFFAGKELEGNHRALEDVQALYVVFRQPATWNRRAFHVRFDKERHTLPPLPDNDDNESDNEDESSPVSLSLSEEEVGTLMEDAAPLGDYWSEGEF
jgi:DNA polymerase III epsilon subunit-like protein